MGASSSASKGGALTRPLHKTISISLVGESKVGKTSLATAFCGSEPSVNPPDERLDSSFPPLPDPVKRVVKVGIDVEVLLQVHDYNVRRDESHYSFQQLIYLATRSKSCIFVVYDVTSRDSFRAVDSWLDILRRFAEQNTLIVIVGTHSEAQGKDRAVSLEEGQKLAHRYALFHYETSLEDFLSIQSVFLDMLNDCCVKAGIINSSSRK